MAKRGCLANSAVMHKIFLSILIAVLSFNSESVAHNGDLHVSQMRNVLNGFSGKQFNELADAITKGIDEKEIIPDPVPPNRVQGLPAEFKRSLGKLPSGNHRVLGHGWALGASIPEDTLQYLLKEYPGKLDEIKKINSMWSDNMVDLTEKLTGLPNIGPHSKAKAFASLLHNIHLLGDVEPGNKIIEPVLSPEDIKKNIVKDLRILADKSPDAVNQIETQLQNVIRESHIGKQTNISKLIARGECATVAEAEKLISQQCAHDLMETLYHANVGPLIHETCPNLSLEFSEKALQRAARRTLDKIPGLAEKGVLHEGALSKSAFGKGTELAKQAYKACAKSAVLGSAEDVVVTAGLLSENGSIIIPALGHGAYNGLTAFFLDTGIASYQYFYGDMPTGQFEKEIQDAAIKGASVGGATAVAIALGAASGGWVIIGVGVGTYFVTDLALEYYHECQKSKLISDKELRKFGFNRECRFDEWLPK